MSAQMPDPGLDEGDPRQLLYGLLEGSGLSIAFHGPGPIEPVLDAAVALAPALRRTHHLGLGFMRFDADEDTTWAAVESPTGSAVVVFCSPESDVDLIFAEVMQRWDGVPAPYERSIITRGSADDPLIGLLSTADVVPLAGLGGFGDLGLAGAPVLPISVRRAAASWRRLGNDLYATSLTEPVEADAFLSLNGGRIELWTQIGEDTAPAWVEPLLSHGRHRIENLDPQIYVVTDVALPVDAAGLDAQTRDLISTVNDAFAGATAAVVPELPPAPVGGPWQRVGDIPPDAAPARVWDPAAVGAFTFTERVRDGVDEDEETFEGVESRAAWLRNERTSGFEYAWRNPNDALLSPSWLTVVSAAVDAETGHVIACGHVTHETWGMSPAFDLGAIDGRNLASWTEKADVPGLYMPNDLLYVGSLRSRVLVPLDASVSVISVDLHGASGQAALLQHLGSSTCAAVILSPDGERRVLTVLEGLSGNESIQFSGDGSWLLVPRTKDTFLVEVATGRWLSLPVGNATWWPGGESSILEISHHHEGVAYPVLYSLSDHAYTQSYPSIELDVPLLETYPYVWHPMVSPDGREVLAESPAGVSVEFQQKNGTGGRLVRFDLESGEGSLVFPALLDDAGTLERAVRDLKWTGRLPAHPVTLHPELLDQLVDPVTTHPALSVTKWADDAEIILVKNLNQALDLTQAAKSIAHLMPEILACLVPASQDPEVWGRRSGWLTSLRDNIVRETARGTLDDGLAASWRLFAEAMAAIEAGRPELIDPIRAGWA